MIIPCPECKKDVSNEAPTCPHCGHPLKGTTDPAQQSRTVKRRAPIFLALSVIALVLAMGTPRLLAFFPLMAVLGFSVIALFRKERLWPAALAVLVIGIVVWLASQYQTPSGAVDSSVSATRSSPNSATSTAGATKNCVKVDNYDSSVLQSNDVFVELAWKADITNSCEFPAQIDVTFKIFDKDDFELDTDSKSLLVAAHEVGKARGKMLVSPPAKANRMTKQGVSLKIN